VNELLLDLGSVIQIVLINLVLSGDNAVVIAMAAHHLPRHQRRTAMLLGCLLAVALISVLTLVVAHVLVVPGVRFAGAVMLIWIACKLLQDETAASHEVQAAPETMRTAIGRIVLADLVMSLDNVLATAGVSHSNPAQLVVGLVIAGVAMLAFSTTIVRIMDRFRWLAYVGTAVLAVTAAQLMWHDLASLPSLILAAGAPARLPDWGGWILQGVVAGACLTSNLWWPGERLEAARAEFGGVPESVGDRMEMAEQDLA
jgi:YjbE family integral membrane protein